MFPRHSSNPKANETNEPPRQAEQDAGGNAALWAWGKVWALDHYQRSRQSRSRVPQLDVRPTRQRDSAVIESCRLLNKVFGCEFDLLHPFARQVFRLPNLCHTDRFMLPRAYGFSTMPQVLAMLWKLALAYISLARHSLLAQCFGCQAPTAARSKTGSKRKVTFCFQYLIQ